MKTKKKERPSDLLKRAKRFQHSRDNLKSKNREKSATIKKLNDRLVELKSSRDHWRKEKLKSEHKCQEQERMLQETIAEKEMLQFKCDELNKEIEAFKKNGRKTF